MTDEELRAGIEAAVGRAIDAWVKNAATTKMGPVGLRRCILDRASDRILRLLGRWWEENDPADWWKYDADRRDGADGWKSAAGADDDSEDGSTPVSRPA